MSRKSRTWHDRSAKAERSIGKCPDCGKDRYTSRKQAMRVQALRTALPGVTVKLRPYQCGEYWHLTSMPAQRIEQIRKRL